MAGRAVEQEDDFPVLPGDELEVRLDESALGHSLFSAEK